MFIDLKLTVCVVRGPPDGDHLGCVPYSNSSIANMSGARSGRWEGLEMTNTSESGVHWNSHFLFYSERHP